MTNFFQNITRPLVFFDLETTGLDPAKDRIVEIAALKLSPSHDGILGGGGLLRVKLEFLIDPGMPIPSSATDIHGIDDEKVKGAPKLRDVADVVWNFFTDCDFAGFNIRKFDVQVLMTELERNGKPLSLDGVRIIDSCDIFHRREPRTLEAALKFYCHKEHDEAHIAMADVMATCLVLEAQLDRYEDLPSNVGELHAVFFDADSVDLAGKLRWIKDEICVNFGKHKGMALRRSDRNYLLWMRDAGVIGPDAAGIIDRALAGDPCVRQRKEQ